MAGNAPPMNPNSFAAKMMAKMGYVEGQGLGATGRGRLAPIETQLRPQGVGLGAVKEKTKQAKEDEKREAAFRGETLEDSEEEERKRKRDSRAKRLQRSANGADTPSRKPKLRYQTVAEIEAATDGLEIPNVLKLIVDATGTETKLLTSTAGLMVSSTAMVPSETEEMKIARRARRDVEASADEWNALSERKKYFDMQEAQLQQELDEENRKVQDSEISMDAIQELQQLSIESSNFQSISSSWEVVTAKIESIDEKLGGDLEKSNMQEIAVAAIHPLFKASMSEWEPLLDPSSTVFWIERLRSKLGIQPQNEGTELALQDSHQQVSSKSKSTSLYETMIYSLWLPPVRSAITNDWDINEPSPLITLIQTWRSLLPPFVLSSVLNQLIVRRLSSALSKWKPQSKTSKNFLQSHPPHIWLFPWLQYLDEQHTDPKSHTGLMADVRRKFKSIFSTWDLAAGIPPGLTSWAPVFQSEFSGLLVRHVLPRLAAHLSSNFLVDPSDQDLDPLTHVLQWSPYFALSTTAQLLIAEFFPKWHVTLHVWLINAPNYDEIREWYLWWKNHLNVLIPDINDLPIIEAEWTKGLSMIDQALRLGPDSASQLPPPLADPATAPTASSSAIPPAVEYAQEAAAVTFRDVVERWCEEHDLFMIPLGEADPSGGLPLFRITANVNMRGGVVAYLKGDVVWVRAGVGKEFTPVGLDEGLLIKVEKK